MVVDKHRKNNQQGSASDAFSDDLLRDTATRKAYSATAMKAFLRLMDIWQLSTVDRCAILGDIPKQTYYKWARGEVGTLSRDQLERIGITLGIHKGLQLLFSSEAGGMRWFKSANSDYTFRGLSPLERMTKGGMTDLYAVRRYLDAMRGSG